jgi:hypothetical protein
MAGRQFRCIIVAPPQDFGNYDRGTALAAGDPARGSRQLPVTRKPEAAQPNLVAILPNRKISLIRPKEVDYKELLRQEEAAVKILRAG